MGEAAASPYQGILLFFEFDFADPVGGGRVEAVFFDFFEVEAGGAVGFGAEGVDGLEFFGGGVKFTAAEVLEGVGEFVAPRAGRFDLGGGAEELVNFDGAPEAFEFEVADEAGGHLLVHGALDFAAGENVGAEVLV